MGVALKELGNLDEAIVEYRRAIQSDPQHAIAHNNLGVALNELGNLDEAIVEYRRAIQIEPKYAIASHNLELALHDKDSRSAGVESGGVRDSQK